MTSGGSGRPRGVEAPGAEVVVRTAAHGADGAAGAVACAGHLLEGGTAVRLVVDRVDRLDGAGCSWETVELLARLRLVARRCGARLTIQLEDDDVRALVWFADLTDVLEG